MQVICGMKRLETMNRNLVTTKQRQHTREIPRRQRERVKREGILKREVGLGVNLIDPLNIVCQCDQQLHPYTEMPNTAAAYQAWHSVR